MAEKQLDLFDRPAARQLWLINFQNPLVSRLSGEFFKSIPKLPGVYRMKNDRNEVIYVGKAKCLRDRLRSYTRANTDNSSRKVLRLVHLIRAIDWEILPDEKAALLRENQLLRTLRPHFNVVNTSPHTYLFCHLRLEKKGITIHVAMAPDESYSDIYGAFKGLGLVYRTHKALFRLLWMSFNECRSGFELPGLLTNHKKLNHYCCPIPENISARLYANLKRLFNGTSKTLLNDLVGRLLERSDLAQFLNESIQADIKTVTEFFERCPKRNRRIKRELKIADQLLAQDQLDDFLVLLK